MDNHIEIKTNQDLSDPEVQGLYGVPSFADEQKCYFFILNDN